MPYICSLTIDRHSGTSGNHYEKLKNALIQLGWAWIETSSFFVQTNNVTEALGALELVAKANGLIGGYSHISYQLQWFDATQPAKIPASAPNHPTALQDIRNQPWP